MSQKTITITAPKGQVVNYDEQAGKITFNDEPKSVIERIQTFEDVLQELNIDKQTFLNGLQELSSDEVAYRKIKLIAKAFNEGWVPDWTNSSQYKYCPWFKIGSPSGVGFSYDVCVNWNTFSFLGSRLCFKSAEIAKHVGNLFIDDYIDFLTTNIE